jgi:hypothetical protein
MTPPRGYRGSGDGKTMRPPPKTPSGTVTPKPITDPHAGQYQVGISFRLDTGGNDAFLAPTGTPAGDIAVHFHRLFPALFRPNWKMADLDVAVREIGAQGETSEDEGRWDRT